MSVMVQQAPISGVSPTNEAVVATVYPSMAAMGIGKKLGELYESIPTRFWGMKISNLIFCPLLIPVSLLLYFWMKVFGVRYTLTNIDTGNQQTLTGAELREPGLVVPISEQPGSAVIVYQAADAE